MAIKAYQGKVSSTAVYIEIAKASFINADETKLIKGKVVFKNNQFQLGDNELFEITNTSCNSNQLCVTNCAVDKLKKSILVNVMNTCEQDVRLKKSDVFAEINILERITDNISDRKSVV